MDVQWARAAKMVSLVDADGDLDSCPDCKASEKELDTTGHKPGCPNPEKAKKLLRSLFGNLIQIID